MKDNSVWEFKEIPCPVCAHDQFRILGYRGGEAHHAELGTKTRIVRCKNCTHQFPNPMPLPNVDLHEIYSDPSEYFVRHDVEIKKANGLALMEKFENRLGKKGRFLDVGCGRGELLWAAKESGWDHVGIDPSKEFIEFGKRELNVEGRVSVLSDAAFDSESFDAIAMSGIIEHLYEPREVLNEVHRILRPNGWLFFDAPNEDGLYMRMGNAYMRMRRKDWVVVLAPTFSPFHVQGFNPRSLASLLDSCRFIAKEIEILGEISPQTGSQTLRKKIEYNIARCINWAGNHAGMGMYMYVWAQKR